MLYSWAASNPDKVSCIAGIYPVGNLESYPGLRRAKGAYKMTAEQLSTDLSQHNPIERLAPLAKANIPLFHIHGDSDKIVPLEENSQLIKERYDQLGGQMTLKVIPGQGHNMWRGWFEDQDLVDFVIKKAMETRKEELFEAFSKLMLSGLEDERFTPEELNQSIRFAFERYLIHPSFGRSWDEIPAPTMTASTAMDAVNSFVEANGWNMQEDGNLFSHYGRTEDQSKPIQGLPWQAINDRSFKAVTHAGVLYVYFDGFHYNFSGVAYNPHTNRFARALAAFKPIGKKWYVWQTRDAPSKGPQIYEGDLQPNKPDPKEE